MKVFRPILFDLMKKYNKKQFIKDIISGIIVAIIALPLTIALSIAAGASPEQGIITAIIGGGIIAFLGGSAVQVSGPTAAFITIVAGLIAVEGIEGLFVATIIAGILLIIMGILKLGNIVKFIPLTITTGFTAGIAATVIIGQLKYFFGIEHSGELESIETMGKLILFFQDLNLVNWYALALGLFSLLTMATWKKISKVIPGSTVIILLGIAMVEVFNLPICTIGDLFTIDTSLPEFKVPQFNIHLIVAAFPTAITLAILIGLESLMSCVVTDEMGIKKHRSNTELIAQGIGNIGSALFGGLPITGSLSRTSSNVKNGLRTPI